MSNYSTIVYNKSENIGDHIQTLAVLELVDIDYLVDPESLEDVSKKPNSKLICNGWFKTRQNTFPLPNNLKPVFISFHLCSWPCLGKELTYFKKNEPIGTRDKSTERYLRCAGIESFTTNCVTLSLENDKNERTDDIYITDVSDEIIDYFPNHIKENATKLTHKVKRNTASFDLANKILDKYKTAKLVITSRIHAALPCIALKTPVIFIHRNPNYYRLEPLDCFIKKYSYNDVINNNIEWNPIVVDVEKDYKKYFKELIIRSRHEEH